MNSVKELIRNGMGLPERWAASIINKIGDPTVIKIVGWLMVFISFVLMCGAIAAPTAVSAENIIHDEGLFYGVVVAPALLIFSFAFFMKFTASYLTDYSPKQITVIKPEENL